MTGAIRPFTHHRPRNVLAALFVAGFLVRIALKLKFSHIGHPQLWEFDDIARTLLDTGVYTYGSNGQPNAFMPPGYPLIIAFLYKLFGVGIAAHLVLAGSLLLFEIGLPFLVGWVAYLVWNRAAGVVAFALALFWPNFLIMSGTFSDLQLYGALLVAACGILFSPRLSSTMRCVLSGLLLGIYAVFRFDAPAMAVPFLYYLVRGVAHDRPSSRRLGGAALFLVAFLIPLSPWLARNYLVFGEPVLSTSSGFNVRRGHHEFASGTARDADRGATAAIGDTVGTPVPGSEIVRAIIEQSPADVLKADRIYRSLALRYIRTHPRREVELAFRKLYYFLVADFTHPVARLWPVWIPSLLALLVGFGFWIRRGVHDTRQQTLWMIFGIQAGIAVVFFVLPRYRINVDFVPLVFFAAWLATVAAPWLYSRRR